MSNTAIKISGLVDILPEQEQKLAYEMVKRMVIAWDPDYTKLTPSERKQLEEAEKDFETGNVVTQDELLKELGL